MTPEVLLFTHPACPVCAQMKPELSRLSQLYDFDFEIIEVSRTTIPIFQRFDVREVPTMMLVDQTNVLKEFKFYYGYRVMEHKLMQWEVIRVGH